MKKSIQSIVFIILVGLAWYFNLAQKTTPSTSAEQAQLLQQYFTQKVSGKMIKVTATTEKLLADDLIAPRHQKFIVRVEGDISLLVTHNIDLAERINSLNEGDLVEIYGQYEWNHRGGILHWTHHDPKGKHEEGWIVHNGKKYQ